MKTFTHEVWKEFNRAIIPPVFYAYAESQEQGDELAKTYQDNEDFFAERCTFVVRAYAAPTERDEFVSQTEEPKVESVNAIDQVVAADGPIATNITDAGATTL